MTADERAGLEKSIISEGCRDALITWNGVLVDGHNRYEICTRNNIPYKVMEKQFPDRNAVITWIIDNQLARRNITAYNRTLLAMKKEKILKEEPVTKEDLLEFLKDNAI